MQKAASFSFALALIVSGCGESATGDGGTGGTTGNGGAGGINGNCPSEDPLIFEFPCSGDITCNYGAETCCGETYPSTICSCYGGSFICEATDACFRVEEFGCGGISGTGGSAGSSGNGGSGGEAGSGGEGGLLARWDHFGSAIAQN
jgi:hypothetical protein